MAAPRSKEATIHIRREDPQTIFVRIAGHVTAGALQRSQAEITSTLQSGKPRVVLFDLLEITGFDSSSVPVGNDWFAEMKRVGVTHVLIAATSGSARMAASAIGFASGVRLTAHDTMAALRAEHAKLLPTLK